MSDERDPRLEAVFAAAQPEAPNGEFADKVMADVESRRRNIFLTRVALILMIIALEVMLNAPIQGTIGAAINALGKPIIEIANPWMSTALAPVNSAAGIVGVILLGLHFLYRKVLR